MASSTVSAENATSTYLHFSANCIAKAAILRIFGDLSDASISISLCTGDRRISSKRLFNSLPSSPMMSILNCRGTNRAFESMMTSTDRSLFGVILDEDVFSSCAGIVSSHYIFSHVNLNTINFLRQWTLESLLYCQAQNEPVNGGLKQDDSRKVLR